MDSAEDRARWHHVISPTHGRFAGPLPFLQYAQQLAPAASAPAAGAPPPLRLWSPPEAQAQPNPRSARPRQRHRFCQQRGEHLRQALLRRRTRGGMARQDDLFLFLRCRLLPPRCGAWVRARERGWGAQEFCALAGLGGHVDQLAAAEPPVAAARLPGLNSGRAFLGCGSPVCRVAALPRLGYFAPLSVGRAPAGSRQHSSVLPVGVGHLMFQQPN